MSGSLVSRRHEDGASPMMASLAPAHGESEAPHWRTFHSAITTLSSSLFAGPLSKQMPCTHNSRLTPRLAGSPSY